MMVIPTAHHALSRNKLLLLIGLMVLSTVLFVAGIALERAGNSVGARAPIQQAPTVAPAEQEGQEGTEAREAQERQQAAPATAQGGAEGTAAHEQAEQNSVFGIDLESPWVIAGVVLGTLLLIAALVVLEYRVLPLVLLVTVLVMIFDVREVVYQLGQARYGIAALAVGVVLSRLATAVVALLAWRERRNVAPRSAAVS